MAKDLSAATGIGSDSDYLNGNIVDQQTEIGEHINQDMIQFFQKLMDIASLSPNGDFDNETNDYQFIDALRGFLKANEDWKVGTVNTGTGWSTSNAASHFEYFKDNVGNVHAIGTKITNSIGITGPGSRSPIWEPPAGYKPRSTRGFTTVAASIDASLDEGATHVMEWDSTRFYIRSEPSNLAANPTHNPSTGASLNFYITYKADA